jgi:phage-related protein
LSIIYYKKASGKEPVKDFIDSLPSHDRARIILDLYLIEQKGLSLCGLSMRQIKGKLWEIKFRLSVGYRIFYCMVTSDIYLLHAYKKQSQKAPAKEIEIALNRMMEVLS